jgi:formylglycine-generating enzyme required for sulfatase activity
MPAEARFNVWLCLANSAIQDGADAAAAAETPGGTDRAKSSETFDTIVDNLEAAAKELNDEAKSSQVLEKLARLKTPEPFDNLELGDVFLYRPKGLNDDPIEFRRVEPSDGSRPFYLATREITFGQFVGAVEGEGLWDTARQLTWPYAPGKADSRRGSRVWEWGDAGGPPRLVLPRERLWMTPDRNAGKPEKHNDFPRDFRPEPEFRFNRNVISPQFGGMPGERHPMQYLTAQAAVYYAAALGCRLPTSQEWRHALTAATGPAAAKANWNLRDETWDVFRRHAEKESIARDHWPDRGAFGEPAAGVDGNREGNDGTLLFRPAPSPNREFHDLIGNVAEYVLEKPEAFARWTSKETAEDIQRFLNDTPNAVGVIGGSALSSPELPLDKPLLLPGARQGERLFSEIDRGFSDVGLRLAFTAPARTHAERLKWVLAGEKYLFPRTASAAAAGAQ